jgi:RHS repeat-associated protein
MAGRSDAGDYRYGFNGMEKDDEVKGSGNSYDFGARMYDSRLGRWLAIDPMSSKYPHLSPYSFVANSPLIAKDPDGRDIIVLNAESGAMGAGHSAVLIGNYKDGWRLYSKNGTYASSGVSGPSDKHPDMGVYYDNLQAFANSSQNFDEEGNVYYTGAYLIETTPEQDAAMKKVASEEIKKDYDLFASSCGDVPIVCLDAVGMDPGYYEVTASDINLDGTDNEPTGDDVFYKTLPLTPNGRYSVLKGTQPDGVDVTGQISADPMVSAIRQAATETKVVNFNENSSLSNPNQINVKVPTDAALDARQEYPQLFDSDHGNDYIDQ